MPKTRREFWYSKFEKNVERDNDNYRKLKSLTWDVLIIWECEINDSACLIQRIREFLGPPAVDIRNRGKLTEM